jgi:hypothetical protein
MSDGADDAPWLTEEARAARPEAAPGTDNPEEPKPAETPAPATPAPVPGQPAEPTATPEAKPEDAKPAEGEEPSPEEAAKRERDELGLSDVEPESPEVLKEKYASSSKEAKALRKTVVGVLELLEGNGVTVAELEDGGLGLVPMASYYDELKDLPLSYEDQSAELREKITKEEFDGLQKQATAALNAKRPLPTATPEQVRLPVTVIDECIAEMGTAKFMSGEARYADIQDPDIQDRMVALYWDDSFEPFRAAMNTSKAAMKVGIGYLHSRVAHVIGPRRAAKADAEAAQKAEQEKRKRDVKPSVEAAAEAAGQPKGSEADDFARQVAYADG